MRSPLTGILFAVELTGDYPLLGSLLIATSASYALTVLLLKRSILTEKIARRGQHVVREYSIDPFELLRVNEVMVTDVDTLPTTMTIGEAVSFFSGNERRHKSYPLIDADLQVSGLVGRADVLRWRAESADGRDTLFDCASDRSLTLGDPDDRCHILRIGWFWPTSGVCRSSNARPGISSAWLPARISCAFVPPQDPSRSSARPSSALAAAARRNR
ncbi:hypothetical protein ABIC10_007768 [Bradyrhizobium sp. S3.2.12]